MSQPFQAYTYLPYVDEFEWRSYTRESLLDQVVRQVMVERYGRLLIEGARVGDSTVAGRLAEYRLHSRNIRQVLSDLLRGILRDGVSGPESRAIRDAWLQWWGVARVQVTA